MDDNHRGGGQHDFGWVGAAVVKDLEIDAGLCGSHLQLDLLAGQNGGVTGNDIGPIQPVNAGAEICRRGIGQCLNGGTIVFDRGADIRICRHAAAVVLDGQLRRVGSGIIP